MREAALEKLFTKLCKRYGFYTRKLVCEGNRGFPDRLLITTDGIVRFVELKTEKGKLSKLQRLEHSLLRHHGARVYTVYGQEQLEAWLAVLVCDINDPEGCL